MEFELKYVRCMWSEEMKGKKFFVAPRISELKRVVEEGYLVGYGSIEETDSLDFPFRSKTGETWRYAYYDPFFDLKLAHEQGKTIQILQDNMWIDWYNPQWEVNRSYRIKPEEEKPEEEKPVTNRELALWLAQGNGQIYHHDDSGFRTEVKTFYIYHQDEDNCDCTVNKYLQCKIRKWGETEWVTPTREYMGLEE